MRMVKFGDSMVTVKAKKMLERAYSLHRLNVPCVIEFEQDDSEYDTFRTLREHADGMGGCMIELHSSGKVERVLPKKEGSGHFLVYIP